MPHLIPDIACPPMNLSLQPLNLLISDPSLNPDSIPVPLSVLG